MERGVVDGMFGIWLKPGLSTVEEWTGKRPLGPLQGGLTIILFSEGCDDYDNHDEDPLQTIYMCSHR